LIDGSVHLEVCVPDIQPIQPRFRLQVLAADQVETIRAATMQILEQIGVHFPSERALMVFAEHGASVDLARQIVRLPADLVFDAMAHAPRSFVLAGRSEGTILTLDGCCSYFATDGCGVETVDFETGQRRPSCKDDVGTMAQVADYLTSIAFYWPMVSAQDCGTTAPLHELDASYNNTSKHVQTETVMGASLARYAVRLAEAVAGDTQRLRAKPPLSSLVCTIAPLAQDREGIEGAMVFAEAGIPVGFMAMPTLGSTAPATVGGALAVGSAEVVSAMVLMQLVAPGAPVYYSLLASLMDPRTADYVVSVPEKYLCNAAAVQIAHSWGVPILGGCFGLDATTPNTWQLGRDSVYTALLVPLAGAEIVTGLGMLKASTLLVPEQILFDDEIYHTHRILTEGIDVDPESLALDVIASVGPKGHFLAQKHTRNRMREIWLPPLSHPPPPMMGEPLPGIRQRARAELNRILTEHEPEPLDKAVQAEFAAILQAAEKELGT
jgi:trimethylamine--corrinoid protein Co-methyltransferase